MSAHEARQHRHIERWTSKHLVSDDDLRRLVGRRHTTALHVMLYVRKRAVMRGRLSVPVTNVELERELGVDRRQIQRAKAHLRDAGFPIQERLGRHKGREGKSGNLACLFVLDRREVEPLKPYLQLVRDEERGGAVPDAVLVKEENTPPQTTATPKSSGVGWPAAARAGPDAAAAASSSTPNGTPATAAPPCGQPPVAGVQRRPQGLPAAAELEPELTHLRRWWTAARQPALSGERAAAVLERAVAAVVTEGGSPFKARLARSLLEQELGLGQLQLGEVPRSGERPNVNDADTSGTGANDHCGAAEEV